MREKREKGKKNRGKEVEKEKKEKQKEWRKEKEKMIGWIGMESRNISNTDTRRLACGGCLDDVRS